MLLMLNPIEFKARKAESLPGPGPLTFTSRFFNPNSFATVPAFSAATCAANGVLFLDPLKPEPPAVAHDKSISSSIGNRHDRIVERSMDMSYTIGNILFYFFHSFL